MWCCFEKEMKTAISFFGLVAKNKLRNFLTKENGEVNVVAIVVLIGVAVILAIIFKGAISNLITTLINGITQKAKTDLELPT